MKILYKNLYGSVIRRICLQYEKTLLMKKYQSLQTCQL